MSGAEQPRPTPALLASIHSGRLTSPPEIAFPDLWREAVEAFPATRTREDLYLTLAEMRGEIGKIRFEQWIGGPFITLAINPEALHCLNLCDIRHFLNLPRAEQEALTEALEYWCNRKETENACGCHSTLALLPAIDDPRRPLAEKVMRAWLGRFGHGHTQTHLIVPLLPPTHAAHA